MMSTQRPSRMPSFSFPWKKSRAIKDSEITIAPQSPTHSWELDAEPPRALPQRFNEWMPSQHTGGSIDSGYASISSPHFEYSRHKDLPSPPPSYEDAAPKLLSRSSHSPKTSNHIGLCQKLVTMAADPATRKKPVSSRTVHFLSQPAELSARQSDVPPQVLDRQSSGTIPIVLAQAHSRKTPMLPLLDTRLAAPAKGLSMPNPARATVWQATLEDSTSETTVSPNSEQTFEASSQVSPNTDNCFEADDQEPVTIFQTDGQCWVFPNVTVSQALALIKCDGIQVEALTDTGEASSRTRGQTSDTSANSSPTSANTSSPTGQGNKRRRNGGRGNRNIKSARKRTNLDDTESKTKPPKYGCPFAKHKPERYSNVFNSCTTCPGIEWKYLIEHLTRVHNASARCIYCSKVWSTPNWEQELQQHHDSGACPQQDRVRSKPECMTRAQEAVYKDTANEQGHPDKRWVSLYMRLFPGAWPIPNPRYNYYIPRHRLITPTHSASSSPVDGNGSPSSNRSSQTRTWYVFSQHADEDENYSPGSDTSSNGGIFSSNLTHPVIKQVIPPAHHGTLVPFHGHGFDVMADTTPLLPQSLGHNIGAWTQNMLMDPAGFVYDTSFSDSNSTVVVPEHNEGGLELLEKWKGQNAPASLNVPGLLMF